MSKTWAALAVAAVAAAGVTAPSRAEAGDFGPGLAVGVAAGALTAGVVATPPYGYVYGPLPYRPYDSAPVYYGPYVDHPSGITLARPVHRGSRVHSLARVHDVARVYHVFDPYYGGGPFYQHHDCCRYW